MTLTATDSSGSYSIKCTAATSVACQNSKLVYQQVWHVVMTVMVMVMMITMLMMVALMMTLQAVTVHMLLCQSLGSQGSLQGSQLDHMPGSGHAQDNNDPCNTVSTVRLML